MTAPTTISASLAPISSGCEPDPTHTALVPVHDASCCLCEPSWLERMSPAMVGGGVITGLATISAVMAALPLKILWVLGVACITLLVLAALPSRRTGAWAIAPGEIADLELRGVYCALLSAHANLVDAAVHYGRSPITRAVLDHSRDVLIACGRIAHTTNPGARYLTAHSRPLIAHDAELARDHTAGPAAAQWAAASTARQRQLTLFDDLTDQRERVLAELTASVARVEAATAELAKQDMLDAAALARTAGSCADHGALLDDALDGLAAAQPALPPA